MKVLIIGFKLSIGLIPNMMGLKKGLEGHGCTVCLIGEKNKNVLNLNEVTDSSSYLKILIESINPFIWFKIYKLLIKNSPDIILFIGPHPLNFITTLIAKIIKKITIISVIHDPIPHSGHPVAKMVSLANFLQAKLSDSLVVYGKRMSKLTSEVFKVDIKKIHISKIGAIDRSFNPKKSRTYFSLVGRLEPYKGIDTFLKAASKFIKKFPDSDVKFIIAGKGDITEYSDLISAIPEESIKMINEEISNEKYESIIYSSFATVLPYNDATNTGNIPLANSLNTPCIVSNVGALPEEVIANSTGLIFEKRDVEGLFNCFSELFLNQKLLIQLEKNSYDYYQSNYKWDSIAEKLIKSLDK